MAVHINKEPPDVTMKTCSSARFFKDYRSDLWNPGQIFVGPVAEGRVQHLISPKWWDIFNQIVVEIPFTHHRTSSQVG